MKPFIILSFQYSTVFLSYPTYSIISPSSCSSPNFPLLSYLLLLLSHHLVLFYPLLLPILFFFPIFLHFHIIFYFLILFFFPCSFSSAFLCLGLASRIVPQTNVEADLGVGRIDGEWA